ncbi:MAG: biotin transporter BioY [Deinococcus-Thermus bacterium]|jgi:biotin transport system substrate-specific component|nr:biotin transporter BioY [Deinococcota bacterium]
MAYRTDSVPLVPLASRAIPIRRTWLRVAVQIVLGVAFLAALAQVRVQIGPVPITGQTLGVLLIGAGYGASMGLATVALYLLSGGLGLAIFSGGEAGWATLAGPTGGYLLGFPLAAALVGWLAQRGWDARPLATAAAMALGNVVIYTLGLAWLARFAPDLPTTLAWGLWPFLAGDAVKIAAAAALLPVAWRLLGGRSRSR